MKRRVAWAFWIHIQNTAVWPDSTALPKLYTVQKRGLPYALGFFLFGCTCCISSSSAGLSCSFCWRRMCQVHFSIRLVVRSCPVLRKCLVRQNRSRQQGLMPLTADTREQLSIIFRTNSLPQLHQHTDSIVWLCPDAIGETREIVFAARYVDFYNAGKTLQLCQMLPSQNVWWCVRTSSLILYTRDMPGKKNDEYWSYWRYTVLFKRETNKSGRRAPMVLLWLLSTITASSTNEAQHTKVKAVKRNTKNQ